MKIQAVLRAEGEATSVWHPQPNGEQMLWCWDGAQWVDPIAELDAQITELLLPHLEKAFALGVAAGIRAARC